jgi:NAD(P)-dependent dehydrogenase (short-subunit alcohol dehydrogenase family)
MTTSARRYLITGASRGLGLEFVRQLLDRGDRVVAACRKPGESLALTRLAGEHPGHLHVLPLDVTNARSRAELVKEVQALWGALDVLINNAGVLAENDRTPHMGQLNADHFRQAFETNTLGPLFLSEAALPLLAKGEAPRVAHISSTLGSIASVSSFYTPSYSVSKAALNMAARLVAFPLSEQGIRSVSLHPGWVKTVMGGPGAPLLAQDSVAGLLQVIDHLPADARGEFLDYQGKPQPW